MNSIFAHPKFTRGAAAICTFIMVCLCALAFMKEARAVVDPVVTRVFQAHNLSTSERNILAAPGGIYFQANDLSRGAQPDCFIIFKN